MTKIRGKQLRNLSGIFFREKIGDKWENVCFEECSDEKQKEILSHKDTEFVRGIALHLAKTINEIGDQFNLQK